MELTSDRLADSIQRILEDDSFHKRAQQLKTQIAEENGVEKAVSVIESYLSA